MGGRIEIDLAQVEECASHGLTQEQIAQALGISVRTLTNRKNESAEFAQAVKRGQAKGIKEISNALFQAAKEGNTTAQIFFLKARAQWRDRDPTDNDRTSERPVVNIYGGLPDGGHYSDAASRRATGGVESAQPVQCDPVRQALGKDPAWK